MNLFERLKPEYKDNLETGNTKHPELVGYVVDQLELVSNMLEICLMV